MRRNLAYLPLRYVLFLIWLAAGCSVSEIAPTNDWAKPDDVTVTHASVATTSRTLVLVDTSGSNYWRPQMEAEVTALLAKVGPTAVGCVVPICSDSRESATPPVCAEPVETFTCWHVPLKTTGFYNTKERDEYAEAATRVAAEMDTCQAALETFKATRPDQLVRLKQQLRAYPTSAHTDIIGSIHRALEQHTDATATQVWIYSDMIDDPMGDHSALVINLAGVQVHVRQLIARGGGADVGRQMDWTTKLQAWGATEIDWKDFSPGEFAQVAVATPEEVKAPPVPVPVRSAPSESGDRGLPPVVDKPVVADHVTRQRP